MPGPPAALPRVGTLLGVWAHPDDEAYLSSALMAAVRRAGSRVVVVTATHGEHGTGDPALVPPHPRRARPRRPRPVAAPPPRRAARARAAGQPRRGRRLRAPLARPPRR